MFFDLLRVEWLQILFFDRIGTQYSHKELMKVSSYLLVLRLTCGELLARIYLIGVLCRLRESSFPSKSPHGIDRQN